MVQLANFADEHFLPEHVLRLAKYIFYEEEVYCELLKTSLCRVSHAMVCNPSKDLFDDSHNALPGQALLRWVSGGINKSENSAAHLLCLALQRVNFTHSQKEKNSSDESSS